MTMAVVLCFLHSIDLVCHGLDVLGFVWWDFLDALVLPMDVFPVGHCGLVFAFVRYLHLVVLSSMASSFVHPGEEEKIREVSIEDRVCCIRIDDDEGQR